MPLLEGSVSIAVEKILLATDFSLSSEKAAAYAKGMAQRFSSTVEITHVFDPSVVPSYEEAPAGEPLNNRLRATVDRLEEIKSEFNNSGIQAETALPEGHRPFAALLRIAKEHQVDLVVAGTESKLGVERLVLGSTAEELIRNAQVPVLTIGPMPDFHKKVRWLSRGLSTLQTFRRNPHELRFTPFPSRKTAAHIFTSVTSSAFSHASLRKQTIWMRRSCQLSIG